MKKSEKRKKKLQKRVDKPFFLCYNIDKIKENRKEGKNE